MVGCQKKWLPRPNHHRIVTCTLARRQNTIPNRRYTLHYKVSWSNHMVHVGPSSPALGPTTWSNMDHLHGQSPQHFRLHISCFPHMGSACEGWGRVRETRTKPTGASAQAAGLREGGRFRVSPAASRREAASRAYPESPPERIPSGRAPRENPHSHCSGWTMSCVVGPCWTMWLDQVPVTMVQHGPCGWTKCMCSWSMLDHLLGQSRP
jgi:hypothetical protein